jgi:hypothetical protein
MTPQNVFTDQLRLSRIKRYDDNMAGSSRELAVGLWRSEIGFASGSFQKRKQS